MRIEIDDHMNRCTAAEVERLLPLVPEWRREQALRYKHLFGQYCCLRSWEMVTDLSIQSRLALDLLSTKSRLVRYNEHGKPFFEDGPFFSISHCKEAIAVVVAEEPVGIDVESIRKADDSLIERVMNEQERDQLRGVEGVLRDRLFTRLWTQKEAIVKALGIGLQSFEQIQGILDESRKNTLLQVESVEKEKYIYSIAYGK